MQQWLDDITDARSIEELEDVRIHLLGRKGLITQALKQLSRVSEQDRKAQGAHWNTLKEHVKQAYRERIHTLQQQAMLGRLEQEKVDVTLPPSTQRMGRPHILTRVLHSIDQYLSALGFTRVDGPEITDPYHNFDALNIPPGHPSRLCCDTFYLTDETLLRTHTSSVQVGALKQYAKHPTGVLRCFSMGRVYRADAVDATHTPVFHQIEGIVLGRGIHFGHLKGLLYDFYDHFFATKELRFRPSFFPFTEPSAEVDVFFQGEWLEMLGCGMIHPNVLQEAGIDANTHQGLAWGMGVERFTMVRYGISDIRHLYETDTRWLAQAPGSLLSAS